MATTPHLVTIRRRICISGVVQGVGFRPFVYNLAQQIGVKGFVLNSSSGVLIEAEGTDAALDEFLDSLRSHPPPLARIQEITTADLEPEGSDSFEDTSREHRICSARHKAAESFRSNRRGNERAEEFAHFPARQRDRARGLIRPARTLSCALKRLCDMQLFAYRNGTFCATFRK